MTNNGTRRACGDCTLCCFTHGVGTSNGKLKDAGEWCKHCNIGHGCAVYETGRPFACYDFTCAWLQGEGMDDERPDQTHVVLHWQYMAHLGRTLVMCGATDDALYSAHAMRITTKYAKLRIPLLREHLGKRRELCFDDDIIVEPNLRKAYAVVGIEIVFLSELDVVP